MTALKLTPFEIALNEIGVKECSGDGNCTRVLEYLDACPSLPDDMQEHDSTPWCAAFINWAYKQATGKAATGQANARSFLTFGEKVRFPEKGDIVVLKRGNSPTSGHVGFFVKQIADKIMVLSGNVSDEVKYSWYSTADVLGYRRG